MLISPDENVATGANGDGVPEFADMSCAAWTSANAGKNAMGGGSGMGGHFFSRNAYVNCGGPTRLYCFGSDLTQPLDDPPARRNGRGRLQADLRHQQLLGTDGRRPGERGCPVQDGGGERGDVRHQRELPLRRLPRTTAASAGSRSSSGKPVYRVDNALVATSTTKLQAGVLADVGPDVRADGSWAGGDFVWGGAANPYTNGTTSNTCADWTSLAETGAFYGQAPDYPALGWFAGDGPGTCNSAHLLYCIEP